MNTAFEDALHRMLFGRSEPQEGGIELHYRMSSMMEFYSQARILAPTGKEQTHAKYLKGPGGDDSDYRWHWAGIDKDLGKSNIETLLSRKFAYKEGIEEMDRDAKKMIQGYKKKVYKWNELDGDELNMERLMEGMPAMRKRIYAQGNKFGNFISLYFNIGVNSGISAAEILFKTKTAVKLIKFFESVGKRVEVVIFSKTANPGRYRKERISTLMLEITVKPFSTPLNISLLNTSLSLWVLRYWELLFMHAKFHPANGCGQAMDIDIEKDLSRRRNITPIIIQAYDCLSQKDSDKFIENILNQDHK